MKKPRTQPAFATLTEAELDQLADWLRHETYEVVLDRVRKPRAEGGLAMGISRSPLERLYAKVALLDLINAKVSEDKKLTLSQFDSLAQGGDILLTASAENTKWKMPNQPCSMNDSDISNPSIQLSTDQAISGSSSLPSRPSVQNPKLTAVHDAILETVHDLATSGDNTPTQLLALQKLADFPAPAQIRHQRLDLDREKFAHKREMDTFRKEVATARLDLAKQSLALREKLGRTRASRVDSGAPPESADHLGPAARNWDEVSERARLHFEVSKEDWSRRQSLPENPGPLSADPNLNPNLLSSAPSAVSPPTLKSEICNLPSTVDDYTIRRAHEYWTWRRHQASAELQNGQRPPPYTTAHRHCPCGQPNPCPDHENAACGEFPAFFWSISPHLEAYEICLTARNLPYRDPYECVPEEFRIYDKPTDH